MTTGADILVAALYHHGVRDLFGMPGSHCTAIYDAVVRHGKIRTILIRNEQAGAYAADGYARVTGRPGVLCTTAGPGATNALSGIAEAWADSMPVLLLAGQVNHDRLHLECGNYHEIDLESIFRPCTKYSGTVMENERISGMVQTAFTALTTGRRRPAALFLPQDLMASAATLPPSFPQVSVPPPQPGRPADIDMAVDLLAKAKRPVLLAGGGAVWSGAGEAMHLLAKRLDCPLVTTLNGKGIIDERDPYCLGHARSVRARVTLPKADAMLAVGCRFTEVFTYFRKLAIPTRLIQVDLDPSQIGINYPVEVAIVADGKKAVEQILAGLPAQTASDWSEIWPPARTAAHPKPEWLIETLRAELPEDGVLFTDASEMAFRMHLDFPAYAPRTFFYPSNYIALGWGFPAAVGAALALPGRPVAALCGDGGFLMTAQELATAARYHLRVIVVVHNDAAYGAMKNIQKIKHEGRFHDSDLNNPDFVKLAEAYGVPGSRAENQAAFAQAFRAALKREGPSLIEVPDQWRSLRI